jgi:dTDP-4-dehydrorhamnose 3,5-epimerase
MKVLECTLSGILVIEPETFLDDRGMFHESYEINRYKAIGVNEKFVQDNHSRSRKNVLRGLHFTKTKPQAQLLTVISGKIFDVVVDLRSNSTTFGKWFGIELSAEGLCQIYMPHGFAHGFCVISESANLHYKVSNRYDNSDEGGLRWNDPDLGITWPISTPVVSKKDENHPLLRYIS